MKMKSAHQPPPLRKLCQKRPETGWDILPMFEKNIADLVQDTDSMQRVFMAIKDNPSPVLSRVLSPLSFFEDQALKVKRLRGIYPTMKLYWPRETPIGKRPRADTVD